jgi:hypothetical protein
MHALESSFPEIMQEMRGIADGSQCSFDDIFFYNRDPILDACSNVAFTGDCQVMLGHVNDDTGGHPDVAFYIRPNHGQEILHIGAAGSVGTGAALNSYGLAMSHACSRPIKGIVDSEAYLNLPLLRRLLVDRNRNCQEAKRFLSTYGFSPGADNIICADRTGDAFVAEKLPTMVEFREPVGRSIYCTGRPHTAGIRSMGQWNIYEEAGPPEIGPFIAREKLFADGTENPGQTLSLSLMQQLLQNSDEGIEVSNERSTWAVVLVPSDFEMWIADRFKSRFTRIRRTNRNRFI